MTINDREDLRRCIKSALASKGMTVSDLARAWGVHPTSMLRSVNRSDLAISDLLRIAETIGAKLRISFDIEDKAQASSPSGEERPTASDAC